MNKITHVLIWAGIFAAAMAFVESAVVVYLRALYYPEGFVFPLKIMDQHILITEIIREASTMIMLLMIGIIAVKGSLSRFAVFIYSFAIWDIFYYVYLVFLLGWPSSFFTWDLLFLIPVTWVGPVLCPVINSLTMILLAVIILNYKEKDEFFRLSFIEWLLLIVGSIVIIVAYTQPYMGYMLTRFTISEMIHFKEKTNLIEYSSAFVPVSFHWILFSIGQILFFWSITHVIIRMKKNIA